MPKLKPEHFTSHLGFIADYMAEIFHNELRPLNFTDIYDPILLSVTTWVNETVRQPCAQFQAY